MAREGRLLYVGITRARAELLITYSGDITPLLPTDDSLYVKIEP
jgi:superfamily I DNA/RNA helicase